MLQLEYCEKLLVMSHIIDAPRPMAQAIASFDGAEDVFYSALDRWSQLDYLRQWGIAIDRINAGCPIVVVVKSVHPPHIAQFCEAYVGWKRGDRYVFQDRVLDLPPSFGLAPTSDWHELAGAYSAVSVEGDPIVDQWTVLREKT